MEGLLAMSVTMKKAYEENVRAILKLEKAEAEARLATAEDAGMLLLN
jgi:hypothetical protein